MRRTERIVSDDVEGALEYEFVGKPEERHGDGEGETESLSPRI
jgi:hypothetical protein